MARPRGSGGRCVRHVAKARRDGAPGADRNAAPSVRRALRAIALDRRRMRAAGFATGARAPVGAQSLVSPRPRRRL
ncbi:hypothetical protein CRX59_25700 [Burkholderia thailandensis]|nr:hypothetical protein WJ25_19460 [Burkholderia thailandensis]NOK43661.1 hypothetical protein [Burkholderia thailandensis]NOK56339.1 hypothetical protein [Burkholderia thailandensis]PHH34054.1 hypothetical protein CRX59_25700 [Burkholderia thailandensis]